MKHTVGFLSGFGGKSSRSRSVVPDQRGLIQDNLDIRQGISQLIFPDSSSGSQVTQESSLGVAAVTACVSLLADMIAKLPIYLYKENGKIPLEITNHPAYNVIARSGSMYHSPFELRHLMEVGRGLGGNGYARVFRNGSGDPISLQWIKPCDIEVTEAKNSSGEKFAVYKIEGVKQPLTRYDILHVRDLSTDGILGKSKIRLLRESIGTSIAQTKAAGNLMKNGARFAGFLKVLGINKKEQVDIIRDEINANMAGVMNAGRIPVVGGDLEWQQTNGMTMTDAQFIESRRFELQEIARIYRIPPFLIGDSTSSTTWGTGIEQQTLGFLNFCLDSHLVCWEQSLALTLLTTSEINEGYFFKFDRDELINASLQARATFYQIMRNIGVYSPNDVRAKLGEPLISVEDGGDDYGKPLNANISGSTSQQATPPDNTPLEE